MLMPSEGFFFALAAHTASFSECLLLLGCKKHLALLRFSVVDVESLFTLEMLAKTTERRYVLESAVALDMGSMHVMNHARKQTGFIL